tara:strand:+ start:2311 stop:2763 length:453 start_codon:yes stop_codon:yes gene_type:complete
MSEIRKHITAEMKEAMRSKDKTRLNTIRLILAAAKQKEVDERVVVSDDDMLVILDKLAKQRKEAIKMYAEAGRDDLKAQEESEYNVLLTFLPKQLSNDEIAQHIEQAIASTGASSIKDMGKIMAIIKPVFQGRADMSLVSKEIKAKLVAG